MKSTLVDEPIAVRHDRANGMPHVSGMVGRISSRDPRQKRILELVAEQVPGTAKAMRDLDLESLVGRNVADARSIVEAAGGTLRTVLPGQFWTMELRANRVTAIVDAETVLSVVGIG